MARLILESQDIREDLELEVNPFAITLEDDDSRGKKDMEAIKTVYSKQHFDLLHANPYYMGEKKVIVDNFEKSNGTYVFVEYKPVYKALKVSSTSHQTAIKQTLQKVPGLLDLPSYIMKRIEEMSYAIMFPNEVADKIDRSMLGETEEEILDLNVKRFIDNNSWTIHSPTKSLRIFCPLLGLRDNYFTMKFLVYREGAIDPYIYMIMLEKSADKVQRVIIDMDGEDYDFYVKLKTKSGRFIEVDEFPSHIVYCDLYQEKALPIDASTPDDCVVVMMTMMGLLPQPDMTRYHNLFRYVEADMNKMTLVHMLSYGYTSFSIKVMTQRIKSFFNREDPSRPKKKIYIVNIILPSIGRKKLVGEPRRIKGYKSVYVEGVYWIDGYKDGNTEAENDAYLTKLLNDLDCNHPHSVIPVGVYEHILYMTYDGESYHLHDPQINQYFTNILDHPYHYIPDTIPRLSLFCIETSEPRQAMISVPEMPLLYEANRLLYKDDLYPTINQAVSHFSERGEFSFPDSSPTLRLIQTDVVSHIPLLSIENQLPLRESITKANDTLYDLQQMRLAMLQHPSPDVSLDKVYHIEQSLQSALDQLTTFRGLEELRRDTADYYRQNADTVLRQTHGIIEEREVYDLLLSKPFFAGFQNFFLEKYPGDKKLFLDNLIHYIRSTDKPVLRLYRMFFDIRQMAREKDLEDQILSYLSYFSTVKLSNLYKLSEYLIRRVEETSGSPRQITDTLFQALSVFSTRFFREYKDMVIKDARDVSINALSIFIMLMNIVKYGSELKNQYLGNK